LLIAFTEDKAESMTVGALARIMRCIATLRNDSPEVLKLVPMLLKTSVRDVKYMAPQATAQMVWSIGTLELEGADVSSLLHAMRGQLVKKLRERAFTMVEISCLLWGFACLGEKDEEVMTAAASELEAMTPGLEDKDASRLPRALGAFARLGVPCLGLLRAAATRLLKILPCLDDWSLWAMEWAYEQLDGGRVFRHFRVGMRLEGLRRRLDSPPQAPRDVGLADSDRPC